MPLIAKSVFSCISKRALEMILRFAPTPRWVDFKGEYHFPTSPSGYYNCPMEKKPPISTYKADRGTVFHAYYGPLIVEAMGFDPTTVCLEQSVRMKIPCAKCVQKFFTFGGKRDIWIPSEHWLLDMKYSEHTSPAEMDDYVPQVAAYAMLARRGFVNTAPEGSKKEIFQDLKLEVDHITLLVIHPLTLTVTERCVTEPLSDPEILKLAQEHHMAKRHDQTLYRPFRWCGFCTNYKGCIAAGRVQANKYVPDALQPHEEPTWGGQKSLDPTTPSPTRVKFDNQDEPVLDPSPPFPKGTMNMPGVKKPDKTHPNSDLI